MALTSEENFLMSKIVEFQGMCPEARAWEIDIHNEKQWREQFLGDFKPDDRKNALVDRLEEYYKSTPSGMDNRNAMKYWKEFICWAGDRGYTQQEINKAKRDSRFRNL